MAHGACTQQEATDKATKFSLIVQARMATDPSQGQALMVKDANGDAILSKVR
jgi:hypothetical protein